VSYSAAQAIVLVFECCRPECGPIVARLAFRLGVASASVVRLALGEMRRERGSRTRW